MAGIEHQVLELVALIDEDVVDAHLREVRHVVLAAVDFMRYLFELRQQVEKPLYFDPFGQTGLLTLAII